MQFLFVFYFHFLHVTLNGYDFGAGCSNINSACCKSMLLLQKHWMHTDSKEGKTNNETDYQWVNSYTRNSIVKFKIGNKKWWSNSMILFARFGKNTSKREKFKSMSTDHSNDNFWFMFVLIGNIVKQRYQKFKAKAKLEFSFFLFAFFSSTVSIK